MAPRKATVKAPVKKKKAVATPTPTPKKDPTKPTTTQKLDAVGEDVIFGRIANCDFLSKIAESYGMSVGSLHAWLDKRPEMYARARERQGDKLVEDMLAIADDASRDVIVDEDGNERTNQEVVARSRLRVEARKWLAGKMHTKRYGDSIKVEAEVVQMTPEQVQQRIDRLLEKAEK